MGLIAFEAAARHLSFTRAAIELNITQAAISHQIKNVEELVGTKLFERVGNNVILTDSAVEFLGSVRAALSQISSATDRISDASDEKSLKIQCLGTFAIKILLPLLPDFQKKYPSVTLKLSTIQSFQFLMPHAFDVGIWHGTGGWPNVQSDRLRDEDVFPVCSPRFLESSQLRTPADLDGKTLIRTVSPILNDEWPFWLDDAGLSDISLENALVSDYLVTSMQAAADGLGIALGRSSVIAGDLENGRLIEPFTIRTPSKFAYYLVTPNAAATSRKAQVFRQWFLTAMGL